MRTPKMPGPTQQEVEVNQTQALEMQRRREQLDAEEKERKRKATEREEALASNRVGLRSLLSGGWAGFQRDGQTELEVR
jgi:hypothetical protein